MVRSHAPRALIRLALMGAFAACRYEEPNSAAQPWPPPQPGYYPPQPGSPAPAPPQPGAVVAPAPAAPRAPWAVANQDPNDDFVVGPPAEISDCIARLSALGVRATPSRQPVHQEGDKTCGAAQVVTYEAGPSGARWSTPPQVTCLVALALARFEAIAQEEAQRLFSSKLKRIDQLGTYSCRAMVRFNMASEHSFANAIDVSGFELQNGTRIKVEPDWGVKTAPATTPASQFLRTVGRRSFDEDAFSVVLGPPWDQLHHDHLHLDQARYRVDGLRVRP